MVQHRVDMRKRAGAIAFSLGVILFLVAQIIHPANPASGNPSLNPAQAARDYTSPTYVAANLLLIGAFILIGLGGLAVYHAVAGTWVERRALVSLILSLVGIGLMLPFLGAAAFAFPVSGHLYLQGHKDAFALLTGVWNGPGVVFVIVGWLVFAAGSIGLAFSTRIGASVFYGIGLTLYGLTYSQGLGLRLLVGVCVATGGVLIAYTLWQDLPIAARQRKGTAVTGPTVAEIH